MRMILCVLSSVMLAAPLRGRPGVSSQPQSLTPGELKATALLSLAEDLRRFSGEVPHPAALGMEKIVAFEENPLFGYVRSTGAYGDRRVLFLFPDTLLLHDRPAPQHRLRIRAEGAVSAEGPSFSLAAGTITISGRALSPEVIFKVRSGRAVEAVGTHGALPPFLAVVLRFGSSEIHAALKETQKQQAVTVREGNRTFSIHFPAHPEECGSIAVSERDKEVLPERLLPAGILPHGPEGVRMLQRWDSAYRRNRRPGWDAGRPAPELTRAVLSGVIRPQRACVLGCGAGTNAVYLAKKGFTVTAVDIAPAALRIAQKRAREQKAHVRWLLADVLALPEIGPFDFLFDRGCYHHVRRYAAAKFVREATRISSEKAHFLILAGNANQVRRFGPPRVKQTDLVNDFDTFWDVVWLKEIRFNDRPNGALAWSALLRRTARGQ